MRARTIVVGAAATSVAAVLRSPKRRLLLSRWMTIGRLGGRAAGRGARARLGGGDEETAVLRTAEDVAATLGQMKGAFMKVGQLASFVDDALPEEVRAALAQLQESAPPMSGALASSVVANELGAPPGELFASWDDTPVAAASIGQVHRAVLRDGTVVAVKVQYPGIAETMAADLAHVDLGRLVLPTLYPHMDVAAITGELRERLTEELDYRIEAANQRDFAAWYEGHPFIDVPAVVDELSTSRVLTTTFADGRRFAELEQRPQAERDRSAEIIFRFVLRSLHDHLAFNGDPHPGNYRFGDGSVTFLDFGLVKRLTPAERDQTVAEVRAAVLDPDPVELRRLVEDAGYFIPGSPLTDELIHRFSALLWSHLVEDRPTTLTPEWASEVVRTYLLKGPEYRELDRWGGLPRHAVVLQRITVGLLAILGRLGATANWHGIAREVWLGEPPCTPLGQLEGDWLAARTRATSSSTS